MLQGSSSLSSIRFQEANLPSGLTLVPRLPNVLNPLCNQRTAFRCRFLRQLRKQMARSPKKCVVNYHIKSMYMLRLMPVQLMLTSRYCTLLLSSTFFSRACKHTVAAMQVKAQVSNSEHGKPLSNFTQAEVINEVPKRKSRLSRQPRPLHRAKPCCEQSISNVSTDL